MTNQDSMPLLAAAGDDGRLEASQQHIANFEGCGAEDATHSIHETEESPARVAHDGARRLADHLIPVDPVAERVPALHCQFICCLDIVKSVPLLWRLLLRVAQRPHRAVTTSCVLFALQLLLRCGVTAFTLLAPRPSQRRWGPVHVGADALCVVLLACQSFTPLGFTGALRALMDVTKLGGHSESVIWTSATVWLITFRAGLLQLPAPWMMLDVILWVLVIGASSMVVIPGWLWHGAGQWVVPGWLVLLLAGITSFTVDAWMNPAQLRSSVRTHDTGVAAVTPSCQAGANLATKPKADDASASTAGQLEPRVVNADADGAGSSRQAPIEDSINKGAQGELDMTRRQIGTALKLCQQSGTAVDPQISCRGSAGDSTREAEGARATAVPGPPDTAGRAVKALESEAAPMLVPESVLTLSDSSAAALCTLQEVTPAALQSHPGAVALPSGSRVPAQFSLELTTLLSDLLPVNQTKRSALLSQQELEELLGAWFEEDDANSQLNPGDLCYNSELQHFTVSAKLVGPPGVAEDVPLLQAALQDSVRAVLEAEDAKAVLWPAVSYRGCVRLLQHVAALAPMALQDTAGGLHVLASYLQERLPEGFVVRYAMANLLGRMQVIPQPLAVLSAPTRAVDASNAQGADCRVGSLRLLLPETVVVSGVGQPSGHTANGAAEGAWHLRVVVSSSTDAAPVLEQRWTSAQLAELPLDEQGRRMLLLSGMATVPPADIARAAEALPLLLVSILRVKGGVPAGTEHRRAIASNVDTSAHVEDELLCCAPVLLLNDAAACRELNAHLRRHANAGFEDGWMVFAEHFVPLAWDLATALCSAQRAACVAARGVESYSAVLHKLLLHLKHAGLNSCFGLLVSALDTADVTALRQLLMSQGPVAVGGQQGGEQAIQMGTGAIASGPLQRSDGLQMLGPCPSPVLLGSAAEQVPRPGSGPDSPVSKLATSGVTADDAVLRALGEPKVDSSGEGGTWSEAEGNTYGGKGVQSLLKSRAVPPKVQGSATAGAMDLALGRLARDTSPVPAAPELWHYALHGALLGWGHRAWEPPGAAARERAYLAMRACRLSWLNIGFHLLEGVISVVILLRLCTMAHGMFGVWPFLLLAIRLVMTVTSLLALAGRWWVVLPCPWHLVMASDAGIGVLVVCFLFLQDWRQVAWATLRLCFTHAEFRSLLFPCLWYCAVRPALLHLPPPWLYVTCATYFCLACIWLDGAGALQGSWGMLPALLLAVLSTLAGLAGAVMVETTERGRYLAMHPAADGTGLTAFQMGPPGTSEPQGSPPLLTASQLWRCGLRRALPGKGGAGAKA